MEEQRIRLTSMRYHPGIRIDRIPVQGIPGFLFVIATWFICLAGVPATRDFLLVSGGGGLAGGGDFYYSPNQTPRLGGLFRKPFFPKNLPHRPGGVGWGGARRLT